MEPSFRVNPGRTATGNLTFPPLERTLQGPQAGSAAHRASRTHSARENCSPVSVDLIVLLVAPARVDANLSDTALGGGLDRARKAVARLRSRDPVEWKESVDGAGLARLKARRGRVKSRLTRCAVAALTCHTLGAFVTRRALLKGRLGGRYLIHAWTGDQAVARGFPSNKNILVGLSVPDTAIHPHCGNRLLEVGKRRC